MGEIWYVFNVSLSSPKQVCFLWAFSCLIAKLHDVTCFVSQLIGINACHHQMSKLSDSLLQNIVMDLCNPSHLPDLVISYHVSSGVVHGSSWAA